MYLRTEFRPFWFNEGDRLSFDDSHFTFIYSEHFLEHLAPVVAHSLLREAYRLLRPGGVIRTVVPDAIFRTYEPPEPPNFPLDLPDQDHNKHKSRWSVYSLSEALQVAGFRAIPLDYCTREKEHFQRAHDNVSGGISQLRRPIDGFRTEVISFEFLHSFLTV